MVGDDDELRGTALLLDTDVDAMGNRNGMVDTPLAVDVLNEEEMDVDEATENDAEEVERLIG